MPCSTRYLPRVLPASASNSCWPRRSAMSRPMAGINTGWRAARRRRSSAGRVNARTGVCATIVAVQASPERIPISPRMHGAWTGNDVRVSSRSRTRTLRIAFQKHQQTRGRLSLANQNLSCFVGFFLHGLGKGPHHLAWEFGKRPRLRQSSRPDHEQLVLGLLQGNSARNRSGCRLPLRRLVERLQGGCVLGKLCKAPGRESPRCCPARRNTANARVRRAATLARFREPGSSSPGCRATHPPAKPLQNGPHSRSILEKSEGVPPVSLVIDAPQFPVKSRPATAFRHRAASVPQSPALAQYFSEFAALERPSFSPLT